VEFERELDDRIAKGEAMYDPDIGSETDLEAARADYYIWNDYNAELLRRRFTTQEIADEYARGPGFVIPLGPVSAREQLEGFLRDVDRKLRRLKSVKERLPLFEEPTGTPLVLERRSAAGSTTGDGTVFIVHGRAEAPKLSVHGFLREVAAAKPVILHDQPNAGRTIIEKFEDHAEEAVFAVILLTGDDAGGLSVSGDPPLSPRARQNVVFELGFFVGALGRNRVAVLYQEGVELPSDLSGLLYIKLDDHGGWKLPLAQELRAAGVEIDTEKLI
jgi:predicted nucleotide-binding protein